MPSAAERIEEPTPETAAWPARTAVHRSEEWVETRGIEPLTPALQMHGVVDARVEVQVGVTLSVA